MAKLKLQRDEDNKNAADLLIAAQDLNSTTFDLHYLFVKEAIEVSKTIKQINFQSFQVTRKYNH